jgi:hypothetical protein
MSKKHPNSRWTNGPGRYTDADRTAIDRKYKEQFGWHNGARVTKRQK